VDKDNKAQKRLNYSQMVGGRYSAMEHLVPEQMFSTDDAPAQGISAVKAISIANTQGQKIWTINQANLDVAMAEINLNSETEREIRNSVNTGKVVTTHEQRLNFNGWIGEGYIILDPETGAGAYKIAGGGNGGFLDSDDAVGLGFAGFVIGVIGAAFSSLLVLIAAAIALIIAIDLVLNYLALSHKCEGLGYIIGLAVLAALAGIFTAGIGSILVMYTGLLAGEGAMAVARSKACQ